jgi:signal transduction histidine kinase/ActR/RegA family two-component response regulator
MNHPSRPRHEERVLVLAPTPADATLTGTVLSEAGLDCHVCTDLGGLCLDFAAGAGVVLLTDEALTDGDSACLVEVIRRQPPWSDVPVILLTSCGTDSLVAAGAMDLLGNVTVLERPVRITTLISTLRTSLRARRRQYELRGRVDTLRQQSERLRLLWEAASVLLAMDDPDAMMRALFAMIAPQFGLDAYFNFVVDESGDALRLASCVGIPDEEARKIVRLEFGQAICGTVALHRRPIMATCIQESDDPKAQLVKGYGIRSYACNPLTAGERLLGTLSFASRSRDRFEAGELEFFETVCHYVAYAYERLRLIRRLREEDRKKDDFLATLAHELRNPLAPIRNSAEYLRLKGPPDLDLRNARDIIERQVRQLTRLVDDLLDISRITRGKVVLQRERVSIGVVLTNAVEAARPLIVAGGHELTVAVPPEPLYVDGDLARLAQIFGNLLTNAAKYTDPGGHVRLSVVREGSDVVVSVGDDGIGIAAEHLPGLFDMFSQVAPALERSQGGLGIGLALVRTLVEMHGGRVEAHSEGPGRGSEFTVRLPLLVERADKGPPIVPTVSTEVGEGPAIRRVLVADDNVDAAQSLAMMLSLSGHEVRTVHDGLAAVEMTAQFRPDVVLLDIGMPKLNGYEAARQVRRQPWGEFVTLVALTGWGREEEKRRAAEAGFDHHFTKPVNPAALEKLLAGAPERDMKDPTRSSEKNGIRRGHA